MRLPLLLLLTFAAFLTSAVAEETFFGAFAEPEDGGNVDTLQSSFDGDKVVIVPRVHPSEAVGGLRRWRNVLFAVRGMAGRAPVFELPLQSPGTGGKILATDSGSLHDIRLAWSYEPNAVKWNSFDSYERVGTRPSTWTVRASNRAPFTRDVIYVSINEHFPVADFYDWLETEVFSHPYVRPTASEVVPGSFVIGYQSGAPASEACSRAIPDVPLFGFVLRDPTARPTRLVVLVSGQHPYEGQNKIALEAAVDWIANSKSAEAIAYRARYVTLVYPFVNPTGELAGLWRGTARDPSRDVNRHWNTDRTSPAAEPGIDTVIVHKNALRKDVAALGMGPPYAVFDYHQNFGDRPGEPDYVLHSSADADPASPRACQAVASDFAPYFARLAAETGVADAPSDPDSEETLRGYMLACGVTLPLTFERSVYHTLASEWAFGIASVKALVDVPTLAARRAVREIPAALFQWRPAQATEAGGGEFASTLLARGFLRYAPGGLQPTGGAEWMLRARASDPHRAQLSEGGRRGE